MITDYQRYCGSALIVLLDNCFETLEIERAYSDRNGYYLLNGTLPIAIKFSRSRKGPWNFTYHRAHQEQYYALVKEYGECITAFVCGKDGVVALDHCRLRQVLDEVFEEQENVTIRRKLRHMYAIKGRDGTLDRKVPKDALVRLVREKLFA